MAVKKSATLWVIEFRVDEQWVPSGMAFATKEAAEYARNKGYSPQISRVVPYRRVKK